MEVGDKVFGREKKVKQTRLLCLNRISFRLVIWYFGTRDFGLNRVFFILSLIGSDICLKN